MQDISMIEDKDILEMVAMIDADTWTPENKMLFDEIVKSINKKLEKAKKYDDLMSANSEVVKKNIDITTLYKEAESLKINIKSLDEEFKRMEKMYKDRIQELEDEIMRIIS